MNAFQKLKSILKTTPTLYWLVVKINKLYEIICPIKGKNNTLIIHGQIYKLKKSIVGDDNVIEIKNSTIIEGQIRIRGNGNRLLIEDGCIIGKKCSFWLEGNNNTIIIGKNTTMTMLCHFNAQEHDTRIIVGEDCMFSNTIIVRTSDSHPIFNSEGIRINPADNVVI